MNGKLISLLLLLILGSCASIVSGYEHNVSVNSTPSEANFKIIDKSGAEVYSGKTPASVSLNSGDGYFSKAQYSIKFEKSGYAHVNPGLSNATVLTSNTANSSSFLTNLGNATVKIGTATGSNILATSAIKGQSINEVIAAQGGVDRVILNSALQIVGEAGAMQIGNAAHTGQITQGQQIALHAALGCGIGAGMSGGGSGCAAGAAAGVIGELTSNAMYREGNGGYGKNTSIAMGGLSGSLASAFTSIALGDDDSKIAKNIYTGSFVGNNAAANNSTLVDKNKEIIGYKNDGDDSIYQVSEDGKLKKIAYSFDQKQFENFDSTDYKRNGKSPSINTDLNFDMIGYANELNNRYDLNTIVNGVKNNASFDLKEKFISLGYTNTQFDGIVVGQREGLPIIASARTVGDFIAGRTVAYESFGHNLNEIGSAGFSSPNFNLPLIGSIQIDSPLSSSITTKIGSGIYNIIQNKSIESLYYFGENPYSGRAINAGINSLNTNPVQYTPNYSSTNNIMNNFINSNNQQNMSTIPIINKDDVLKQYLK